jgi:hypothetical protein
MNATNRVTPFTNNAAFKIELKATQTLTTSWSRFISRKETFVEMKTTDCLQWFKFEKLFDWHSFILSSINCCQKTVLLYHEWRFYVICCV